VDRRGGYGATKWGEREGFIAEPRVSSSQRRGLKLQWIASWVRLYCLNFYCFNIFCVNQPDLSEPSRNL
jgi:hypothetical protein